MKNFPWNSMENSMNSRHDFRQGGACWFVFRIVMLYYCVSNNIIMYGMKEILNNE
jgi:hypothetical protein